MMFVINPSAVESAQVHVMAEQIVSVNTASGRQQVTTVRGTLSTQFDTGVTRAQAIDIINAHLGPPPPRNYLPR